MIIDGHCHAGKGDGLTGPWDTAAPLDKYLLRAAQTWILVRGATGFIRSGFGRLCQAV
jgi:hypothetical protein